MPIGKPHPTKRELNHLLYMYAFNKHNNHLLCSYTRFNHTRTDPLFDHPCRTTQLKALRWRRNAFRPTEFICPVEGAYLSRSHVNHLLEIFVEPLVPRRQWEQWEAEQQEYPENKYTILDFLLNHQLYDIFMECIFIAFDEVN